LETNTTAYTAFVTKAAQ